VDRVLVLGRGAAGKSTAARRLGCSAGLRVIELDQYFWRPGLVATPRDEWIETQRELTSADRWVIDGDLGPYDVLSVRLGRADTVLILDFSLPRCTWRAVRRSRERADFWWWVLTWRRQSLPTMLAAVATYAPSATVHRLRTPRQLQRWLSAIPTSSA
jgi:adenylate kinase family enzyme